MRLSGSQEIEAYMSSWAKEKGVGVCDFKGEENNSQEYGKSKCLVNKCLPCSADKSFWCKKKKKKSSFVITLLLIQAPYLKSFRQLRGRQKALLESVGPWLSVPYKPMPEWHILGRPVLNPIRISLLIIPTKYPREELWFELPLCEGMTQRQKNLEKRTLVYQKCKGVRLRRTE